MKTKVLFLCKVSFFIGLLLFPFSISAQKSTEKFDIANYYTPDIVRNEMELHLNFESNSTKKKDEDPNDANELSTSSYSLFGNDSRISFKRIINTRKRITNLGSGFNVETKCSKYETSKSSATRKESNSVGDISYDLHWSDRRYLNSPFFFSYSLGGELSRDYYSYNEERTKTSETHSVSKESVNQLRTTAGVGIGWGRIEDVTDARQAIYIIDALREKGVLNRELSVQEMFEFSQLISSVKNKRFLDSRLHLIEELTVVDDYLKNKGVIADDGATYFTTLNDMWQYGALFERQSGYEITFDVRPWLTWGKNKKFKENNYSEQENINSTQPYNSQLYMAFLDFSYHKPVKNVWQHSFSARAYYSGTTSNTLVEPQYRYFLSGGYWLSYYPNTRTHLSFYLSGGSNWEKLYSDFESRRVTVLTPYIQSGLRIHYYFSPQLSISGGYGLLYSLSESENASKNHFLNTQFEARLIYKFF